MGYYRQNENDIIEYKQIGTGTRNRVCDIGNNRIIKILKSPLDSEIESMSILDFSVLRCFADFSDSFTIGKEVLSNIPLLYQIVDNGFKFKIIMEKGGKSICQQLDDFKSLEKNTLIHHLEIIIKQVMGVLCVFDKLNIIHGDLSSNNILYDIKTEKILIIDFETSLLVKNHIYDQSMCTEWFRPPEVSLNIKNISCKGDVYSFGTVLSMIRQTSKDVSNKISEMMKDISCRKSASELYKEWYGNEYKLDDFKLSFDFHIGQEYLSKHNLNSNIRKILTGWLNEVKDELLLDDVVLDYGIRLTDAYCDKSSPLSVCMENYQLVGQVGLWLSMAIINQNDIDMEQIINFSDKTYTMETVKEMIIKFFRAFDFLFFHVVKFK
jgi:serine/threonine protein kinase